MKKFAAGILALLYLATSAGATVRMHYCMGQLISAGLWHYSAGKNDCSTCGMEKKKGCCEDRHTTLKIDKQYDAPMQASSISSYALQGPSFHSAVFQLKPIPSAAHYPLSNSPPGSCIVPLYISHCVYRI